MYLRKFAFVSLNCLLYIWFNKKLSSSQFFDLAKLFCSELMDIVKTEGRKMANAQQTESAVGNMIRRGTCILQLVIFNFKI